MDKKSTTFEYNGLKVAYKTAGQGKPLLILHGWGTSSRVMAPLASQLQDIRSCCLVDLPGFGDSPEPPEAWGIDDYADMVESLIQSVYNSGERVDLLVHSFGGRITLKLLTRGTISGRIDKVLITGGAGMKPRRSLAFYFRKYLAKTLKAPLVLIPPGRMKDRAQEKLRQTALWKKLGSSDYSKLSGTMRGTFVKSVNEHLDQLLPQIDHEILLLWGDTDEATPLYQAKRMESGLQNSALVVIDGAGHYAFLDKPKRFVSITKAFFAG